MCGLRQSQPGASLEIGSYRFEQIASYEDLGFILFNDNEARLEFSTKLIAPNRAFMALSNIIHIKHCVREFQAASVKDNDPPEPNL